MNIKEFYDNDPEARKCYYYVEGPWDEADCKKRMEAACVPYGDMEPLIGQKAEPPEGTVWYEVQHCGGSDYSGGICNRSNHQSFLEMFGGRPGVLDSYGGYGTYAIFLRADVDDEEILDCLRGLADYPLIDDEALSALEVQMSNEAWEHWAESDFRQAIEKALLEGEYWEASGDVILEVFQAACEKANEYWEVDGEDMWIRVDKVAAKVAFEDLDDMTKQQVADRHTDAAELEARAEAVAAVNNPDQGKLPLEDQHVR